MRANHRVSGLVQRNVSRRSCGYILALRYTSDIKTFREPLKYWCFVNFTGSIYRYKNIVKPRTPLSQSVRRLGKLRELIRDCRYSP